jgi:hypothetical protein
VSTDPGTVLPLLSTSPLILPRVGRASTVNSTWLSGAVTFANSRSMLSVTTFGGAEESGPVVGFAPLLALLPPFSLAKNASMVDWISIFSASAVPDV